ncbi:unnamed protein product [Effrenium voratum]|nr:unnamed protein product [Effrenium voratum]
MDAVIADFQQQLERQHRVVEERHTDLWQQLRRHHLEALQRLEAENAALRAQLAAQKCASCCEAHEEKPSAGELSLTVDPPCVVPEAVDGTFSAWSSALCSPPVQLRIIADDVSMTLTVHKAVLQRSPYFQARLAEHWMRESAGLLPLRLPPGCPASAASLVFRHLYVQEKSTPGGLARSGAQLRLGDATVAIGAQQLAEMLLLEDLAEELSRVATSLLASPEEARRLQERFVSLPPQLTKVCQAVQRSPAAELRAEELALMLRGSAGSAPARPQAQAVLAACAEAGAPQACREAVISALEALPFKIPLAPDKGVDKVRINRAAFEWLWDLAEDYVLVTEIPSNECSNACGRSLLPFFTGLARAQELHSSPRCPNELFDDTAEPVRLAFGAYLQHLAILQQCEELNQAFRLGAAKTVKSPVIHRSQTCTIHYPNMLHFGLWPASQNLLPRLLQAPAARAVVLSSLLELPAEALAELVTDALLEALGADAVVVCNILAKDPNVLASWATCKRLLALPLLAQRRLCACLAPSLGSLSQDIAQVVVQVLAGNSDMDSKHRVEEDVVSRHWWRALWLLISVLLIAMILRLSRVSDVV